MPRKTDPTNPADWIAPLAVDLTEAYFADRYPGFDLEDPDWPHLAHHIEVVGRLLALVSTRCSDPAQT